MTPEKTLAQQYQLFLKTLSSLPWFKQMRRNKQWSMSPHSPPAH